jgi:beta-lactamase class C
MNRPNFLRLILGLCCLTGGPQVDAVDKNLAQLVDVELLTPMAQTMPGAAAVVVIDGKVALLRTWGVRQAGASDKVDGQTLFRLASVSKTFAGAAGAKVVSETDLEWHTTISGQVDGLRFKVPARGNDINLRHVLSQGTGLIPHAYTNLVEDNMSFDRILRKMHKVDFICEPGQCYSYQNVAFSLVGEVIEQATGMDYSSYLTKRIFEPLAMKRASIGFRPYVDDTNHARPHRWNGEDWAVTRITSEFYRVPPAAGVNASIDDMAIWLLAQLGQKPEVLGAPLLDEMHRGIQRSSRKQAHYPRNPRLGPVYYGLGWRVFEYGGQPGFVHHGGYVRGMRSEMVLNRELGAGLVFLTNSEPRNLGDLVFAFVDLLLQERGAVTSASAAD